MKKRILSLLLTACMLLSLLPGTASAAEITTALTFTETTEDASGDGYTWVKDTLTLTLSGLALKVSASAETYGITLPEGSTLVLANSTTNTVEVTTTGGEARGIYANGALTIEGTGALSVTATSNLGYRNAGIRADGALTITGGDITAKGIGVSNTGGGTSQISCGIYTEDTTITLSGGSVTAVGTGCNNANDSQVAGAGYGIYAKGGGFTISGSAVVDATGTGGKNTVKATSSGEGYGILGVTITGGTVTARGIADSGDETAAGIYNATITGGTVTATGATASATGHAYGIERATVSGDPTVTATATATAGGTAYGVGRASVAGGEDALSVKSTGTTGAYSQTLYFYGANFTTGSMSSTTETTVGTATWGDGTKGIDTTWAGSGTEADPHQISTAAELSGLAWLTAADLSAPERGKFYQLTGDIILNTGDITESSTTAVPWMPITVKKTFDGQGHTVSGIYMNYSYKESVGLFESSDGTTKNLTVTNGYIKANGSTTYAGGIAATNDYGTIDHCANTGVTVVAEGTSNAAAGGITGKNGKTIRNCYNTAAVSTAGAAGNQYAGGIAADQYSGSAINCYNTGAVNAAAGSNQRRAGGILGDLSGTVTNCYNTGTISGGANQAGGIAGYSGYGGKITGCYAVAEPIVGKTASAEYAPENCDTFTPSGDYTLTGGGKLLDKLNAWLDDVGKSTDYYTWKNAAPTFDVPWTASVPPVTDPEAEWTPTSGTKATGTFAAALAAMETTGGSIKLLKNITLTETAQFISSITLDLNGHDITQTTKTLPVLAVGTGGAVVLCDSTASTTNNVYTAGTITGGLIGVSIVGGSFELHSGKISGNGADTGSDNSGGVLVGEGNNSFTMSGGEISGNMGDYGAGVNVDGSFQNQGGSFTMSGGTIKNNTARRGGGGISVGNDTTFTMNDGTIDHNSATAGNGGGGINSANGTVVLKKGTVTGNTVGAENSGATGGIYCYNGASLTLSGDVIVTGNTFEGKAADITIAKNSNAAIILTSEMKNIAATAIQLRSGEAGDTLVKSDGTYTITASDLAKFTSADSDFTFALDGAGTSTVIKLASASVADAEAEWTVGSETKTGTFAEALTAMQTSGGSIKLLKDVSTADSTILPARAISLDLNGKTWSSGREVRVVSGGTLNLSGTSGGKILNAGAPVTVQSGSTLNLSGGTIESSKDIGYSALSNSGTVVMSGGKIVRSGHNIAAVTNKGTFSMTGGEITCAMGDGVDNKGTFSMTGGTIMAKGYGVSSYAKVYLGGTASITSRDYDAVFNSEILYLFGTPILTKGGGNDTYQISCDGGTIVASNGKSDSELAYYIGGELSISYYNIDSANKVLVSGIENEAQSKKFNITISNSKLEPIYNDNDKTIIAKGKTYTITYKDRAKADDGAAFSGTHGANHPTTYTAGTEVTLVNPIKENHAFGGWYEYAWGSTDEAVTELDSYTSGNVTLYAKWIPNNITEKTAAPALENTIDAANSYNDAYFDLKSGAEYQEQVEYKLYTAATGMDEAAGITAEDDYGESIEISPVTVSADYWLSATEDGKLESDRVKISVRPEYSGLDTEGYLTITTPQELADYLNYCEPDSAVVNGTTVTQSKDVHSLYNIYFAGNFEGVWDLGGQAVRPSGKATIYLLAPDEYDPEYPHAENVKLTVKNGTISGNESAFSMEAGTVTLESVALNAYELPIDCYNGTLTMTDVTATVKAMEGAEDDFGTQSAALYTSPLVNITIHSGKLVNEYQGGITYYSSADEQTPGKKLSACIPATSISVPADSVSKVIDGVTYEFCTETVTVTKNGGQPVPTYTLTYNGNGSTSGAAPTDSNEYRTGTSATVLGNTGTLTKTGHIFAGWNTKSDGSGTDYAAGASLTITGNTTLYAKWTPVFDVGGDVTDNGSAVVGATVELMRGSAVLKTDTTAAGGVYKFAGVTPGVYNVKATSGAKIKTILVTVVNADLENQHLTLPSENKNSVVDVKPDTPPAVVGGLDDIAEGETVTPGSTVTIKLTVESKAEGQADNAADIKTLAGSQTVGDFLDLALTKQVDSNQPESIGATNATVLEIVIPYNFAGKKDVTVYRHHGEAQKLTKADTKLDGTFRLDEANGLIAIYAAKFSTYAVAYSVDTPVPPVDNTPSVTTYAITAASGEGGAISPKGTVYVNRNGSKTFTITPNEGYEIADVLVDGKSVGAVATYTFEKVTAKHTIEVFFRRTVKNPFVDVTEDDWFYDAVTDLYEKGLMTGTGDNRFSPLMNTDRATIVTILWRMEGMPSNRESAAFPDVPADAWYAQAVAWGHKAGVVKGYDTGKFGPTDPITREQLAAILWRYAGSPVVLDYEGTGRFTDTEAISPWAAKAVTWALSEGLLTGKGDGILDPTGHATRAEAAAMLARFLKSSDN